MKPPEEARAANGKKSNFGARTGGGTAEVRAVQPFQRAAKCAGKKPAIAGSDRPKSYAAAFDAVLAPKNQSDTPCSRIKKIHVGYEVRHDNIQEMVN